MMKMRMIKQLSQSRNKEVNMALVLCLILLSPSNRKIVLKYGGDIADFYDETDRGPRDVS